MSDSTLIYGLGESGIAAANALIPIGENVVLADSSTDERLREISDGLGVPIILGATESALSGVERVVVSPGISPRDALLRAAERRDIPVISEVGLGLEMLESRVRVAAITGTNGKTTAVDMLRAMLSAGGVENAVAGNSWRALTGCLDEVNDTGTLALEVSSFQLHYLPEERDGFDVAGLLNVRPDHLNWHTSYEEYVRDKLRIFDGQSARDLALLSESDPVGREAANGLSARSITVGSYTNGSHTTGTSDGMLVVEGEQIVPVDDLSFTGPHNYENAAFAAAAAMRFGVSSEDLREALLGYRLKSHRMEVVHDSGGVLWVDDSKATNPAATAAALSSYVPQGRPVVLILGGSEKDTDFAEIEPFLGGCRAVICQGEVGPRLYEWLASEGFSIISSLVHDLESAVEEAKSAAQSGDVVLLSPGCASFDQFVGYAERGDSFARFARGESVGA